MNGFPTPSAAVVSDAVAVHLVLDLKDCISNMPLSDETACLV